MSDQSYLAQHIIEIYKKHAKAWTILRGEYLYEKSWLDQFIHELPQSAHILDLGCGSGKPIAQYFIQQNFSVTGIDSSDVMIEMARENFPEQNWIKMDMRIFESLQKFQGILAWDSFFHLTKDDQRTMFQQFSQYAAPQAMLMFSSGPSEGEAIGDMFGDALYHASLSQAEYVQLLEQHGFEVIQMIAEDTECTGRTVWLAKKR